MADKTELNKKTELPQRVSQISELRPTLGNDQDLGQQLQDLKPTLDTPEEDKKLAELFAEIDKIEPALTKFSKEDLDNLTHPEIDWEKYDLKNPLKLIKNLEFEDKVAVLAHLAEKDNSYLREINQWLISIHLYRFEGMRSEDNQSPVFNRLVKGIYASKAPGETLTQTLNLLRSIENQQRGAVDTLIDLYPLIDFSQETEETLLNKLAADREKIKLPKLTEEDDIKFALDRFHRLNRNFQEKVLNQLLESNDTIRNILSQDSGRFLIYKLSSLLRLREDLANLGKELLTKNLDLVEKNLAQSKTDIGTMMLIRSLYDLALITTDEIVRSNAIKALFKNKNKLGILVENFFKKSDNPWERFDSFNISGLALHFDHPIINDFHEQILSPELSKYGIDTKIFLKVVQEAIPRDSGSKVGEMFGIFRDMEKKVPGSVRLLNQEYGIYLFSRYPIEVLLDQCKAEKDTTSPYGIVMFPLSDHNGAFFNAKDTIGNLHKQLKRESVNLRITEVGSKLEAVRKINRIRKKHGKISFAYVGGHGTEDTIKFGKAEFMNSQYTSGGYYVSGFENVLHLRDVFRQGMNGIRSAFIDNPTIILESCTTGALGGIGQNISKVGGEGVTVIAPDNPSGAGEIKFKKGQNGKMTFLVKYRAADTETYTAGIPNQS